MQGNFNNRVDALMDGNSTQLRSASRDTLQSRGYYMSETDVTQEQDAARGKYYRLKETFAVAEARKLKAAEQMKQLARELCDKPISHWVGFNFEERLWLNVDGLKQILSDAERAQNEMNQARSRAINLGVAITD